MPSTRRRKLKKLAALKAAAPAESAAPAEEETAVEVVAEKVKKASKSLGSKLKKLITKKEG